MITFRDMSRFDYSSFYRPEKLVLFNNDEEPRHGIPMFAFISHILIPGHVSDNSLVGHP